MTRSARALALLLPCLLLSGCIKNMAMNALANTLSGTTGGSFTQDDDLQFVGESLPFALKLMEGTLEAVPDHLGLHDTLCSGITQYAAVYVKWPADQARYDDWDVFAAGMDRTRKFLRRAEGYCFGALELAHPGFGERIRTDREAVLAEMTVEDIPRLYWGGAVWLGRISISKEDMEAIGELPVAAAMLQRAIELDPAWDKGALHDMMILLEPSLPMPGGLERAREHYALVDAAAGGTRASHHVSLATSVSTVEQNKEEFVALMNKALEVDVPASPSDQLANLYAQAQATFYMDHLDDLFAF